VERATSSSVSALSGRAEPDHSLDAEQGDVVDVDLLARLEAIDDHNEADALDGLPADSSRDRAGDAQAPPIAWRGARRSREAAGEVLAVLDEGRPVEGDGGAALRG